MTVFELVRRKAETKDRLAADAMELMMAASKAARRDVMTAVETDSRSVDRSGIVWVVCLVGKKELLTAAQWAALMDEQWAAWKGLVMDSRKVGMRDLL